MEPSRTEDTPVSSPASTQASSVSLSIAPSNYLTVPTTRAHRSRFSLRSSATTDRDEHESLDSPNPLSTPSVSSASSSFPSTFQHEDRSPRGQARSFFDLYPQPILMSEYSRASSTSETSEYSNPPARSYQLPSFATMSRRRISVAEKEQMIESLRTHRVNTLVELRRIEQAFATIGSPDLTEPMTAAWSYYVNYHSLLTELRGLTKNYPFSSECLEEAKRRVYSDPESNRSWNLCWLVLCKIQNDQLIPYYARYQASLPSMWGGRVPSAEGVDQLTGAFTAEWNYAVSQMLRHWDQPPTR